MHATLADPPLAPSSNATKTWEEDEDSDPAAIAKKFGKLHKLKPKHTKMLEQSLRKAGAIKALAELIRSVPVRLPAPAHGQHHMRFASTAAAASIHPVLFF